MPDTIYIGHYNHSHMFVISSNEGIEYELRDRFSFFIPGYRFMPAFKTGRWDGKIRLYNQQTKLVYVGLLNRIKKFAKDRGYQVVIDKEVVRPDHHTMADLVDFVKTLNLPADIVPRDYQLLSVLKAINEKRLTLLSPTASGKSLIIYLITQFLDLKTLIIVPTTSLVHQMSGDFKEYGYDEECHLIYSGKDKEFDNKIGITTWQSIYKMPRNWFTNRFDLVIVDEVHGAKAKSLTSIMEKMTTTEYKFGTTGTLDGTETNQLTIEGLFGPVFNVTTTEKLIREEVLANFSVECLLLRWGESAKTVSQYSYQEEIDWIVTNEKRNQFIAKLVTSIPGNNLVLVNFVDKHAKPLHEMIKKITNRPVYYIDGKVDAKIRDEYRAMIEKETDAIIVATTKSFATGTNVKRLNNIFFCHPNKSRITTLQAIGRVLRKSQLKTTAKLHDIVDDLTHGKKKNFSMKHFLKRLEIYKSEKFPYVIKKVGYK